MCVGVQGPNVCWTGGGQTVVLIVLGPSLFTYVDPSEAMNMQQLPVLESLQETQKDKTVTAANDRYRYYPWPIHDQLTFRV